MSYSSTLTETTSFTVTHARYMSAKVAADLKRMQRFYGVPSDAEIADYEAELVELIKAGYLGTITYGFKRNGNWITPTLKYTAADLENTAANDEDPGRVPTGADISGASFYNHLTHNSEWYKLPQKEKEDFEDKLPFRRTNCSEPGVDGFFQNDKIYSSGGRSLNRSTVRSY